MMAQKHILYVAIIGLVAVSGCLGMASEGTVSGDMDDDEFEAFIEQRNSAVSDADTLSVNRNIGLTVDGETHTISMDGNVSTAAGESKFTYEYPPELTGQPVPRLPSTFDAYHNETHMIMEDGDGGWDRLEDGEADADHAEAVWDAENPYPTNEVYQYGDVSVDEQDDVVVITTTLSERDMYAITSGRNSVVNLAYFTEPGFDELQITETVDAETHYTQNSTVSGTVSDGDASVSFTAESTYSNYGKQLDAEIPAAVHRNASDAPLTHPFA